MDSLHLTFEDLDNSLLTEWLIQKTFYCSSGKKNCPKQVYSYENWYFAMVANLTYILAMSYSMSKGPSIFPDKFGRLFLID